jgi:two-component system, NtrC family, sensor kinase
MKIIRRSLLFVLTTLAATSIVAQRRYTDSLNIELSKAMDDTGRVLVLADLAYYHRYQNLDTAMLFAQRALALSQEIEFARGESLAYQMIGITHRMNLNMPSAFENLYKGLKIAEENNLRYEEAMSFVRIAQAFSSIEQHTSALKFILKALNTLNPKEVTRAHLFSWLSLGLTYERLNKIDSSEYYKKKVYDNVKVIPDFLGSIYAQLANDSYKKGEKSLALGYFYQAIEFAEKNNNLWEIARVCADIADVYQKDGNKDSAIYYAKRGLENGIKVNATSAVVRCGNLLADIYESSNPAEALRCFRIATTAKESLFGAGNLQAIQAVVEKEEARLKDLAMAKAAYQTQLKLYGLLAGLGLFLVVAFILYRNNRQKQKANVVLQQQKDKVESTLHELKSTQSQLIQSEKMASLGELTAGIAHEIQNPLNFVNNFSEVNKELAIELEEEIDKGNYSDAKTLAKDIRDNEEKINLHGKRADAIVKGMLAHSRTSSGQKEPTDINALCNEYLRLAYHGLKAKDPSFYASFHFEPGTTLPKVNVVPQDIGRVLLNLINNAFYAVQERSKKGEAGYSPEVVVSTMQDGNQVKISVRDNGGGIPDAIREKIFQPFFTTKSTGEGTGLGLSLSYDIVKAHGGAWKLETKEGEGSTFMIQFPIV